MLEIDRSGNIKVSRGDTFEIPLFIDVGENIFTSTRLPLKYNDIIYFHIVSSNCPFDCPILGKSFTYEDVNENNDIIVRFNHEDTEFLSPGIYYYEVKLQRRSGSEEVPDMYVTIVPRRKFVIQ